MSKKQELLNILYGLRKVGINKIRVDHYLALYFTFYNPTKIKNTGVKIQIRNVTRKITNEDQWIGIVENGTVELIKEKGAVLSDTVFIALYPPALKEVAKYLAGVAPLERGALLEKLNELGIMPSSVASSHEREQNQDIPEEEDEEGSFVEEDIKGIGGPEKESQEYIQEGLQLTDEDLSRILSIPVPSFTGMGAQPTLSLTKPPSFLPMFMDSSAPVPAILPPPPVSENSESEVSRIFNKHAQSDVETIKMWLAALGQILINPSMLSAKDLISLYEISSKLRPLTSDEAKKTLAFLTTKDEMKQLGYGVRELRGDDFYIPFRPPGVFSLRPDLFSSSSSSSSSSSFSSLSSLGSFSSSLFSNPGDNQYAGAVASRPTTLLPPTKEDQERVNSQREFQEKRRKF